MSSLTDDHNEEAVRSKDSTSVFGSTGTSDDTTLDDGSETPPDSSIIKSRLLVDATKNKSSYSTEAAGGNRTNKSSNNDSKADSNSGDGKPSQVTDVHVESTQVLAIRKKKHTVYNISVTDQDESWIVNRRYKHFQLLRSQLIQHHPTLQLPLPSKNPIIDRLNRKNSIRRLNAIEDFLKTIVKTDKLMDDADVQEFLKLSSHGESADNKISSTPEATKSDPLTASSDLNIDRIMKTAVKPTDFDFLKLVGKGSYGKVFMARHRTEDKIYAIKVLTKAQVQKRNEVEHVMSERHVMVNIIDHPFLVKMHYSFQTADKLYFVVDFINGGELFFHLQNEQIFPENRARFYSAEIVSAIGCLHSRGVIYRDLKPENILLDSQGHIKITDFGLCKRGMKDSTMRTSTFCGTPEYLAPEIIKKKPYTRAVDWWCVGAVLYEMLMGTPPFYNKNYRIMHNDILHKQVHFRPIITAITKDLLIKCLEKQPDSRIGAGPTDAQELMNHAFYANIDFNALIAKQIKPPVVYETADQTDLRFIDPEFVNEPIPASVRRSMKLDTAAARDEAFLGFTFIDPNHTMSDDQQKDGNDLSN